MIDERHLARQRRNWDTFFLLFVSIIGFVWVATLVDWAFDCGWGWNIKNLWVAPPVVLFAGLIRFCGMAVFKFVANNY